jgi:hypothetical protein
MDWQRSRNQPDIRLVRLTNGGQNEGQTADGQTADGQTAKARELHAWWTAHHGSGLLVSYPWQC